MLVPTAPQKDFSRRAFFQRVTTYAVGAAVIQGFGPSLAVAQAKVAQNTVSYQDKPKGTQRCDGCSLFQPPNACKVVAGEVSPQGWCSLFSQKA
jgi:High potential iron-sulfur protein